MKQIHISEKELNECILRAINEITNIEVNEPAGIPMNNVSEDDEEDDEDKYLMKEKLPQGWEKIEREDDSPIYNDPDGFEYVKDEYGHFKPIDDQFDDSEELYEVRRVVRKMLRESFGGFQMPMGGMNNNFDMGEGKRHKKSFGSSNKGNLHKKHYKENPKTKKEKKNKKRAIVLAWLKNPKNAINCTEIMRQLWNPSPEDEDTKRGLFFKMRDGALNDSGNPYAFSDEEINKLYTIKSNRGS